MGALSLVGGAVLGRGHHEGGVVKGRGVLCVKDPLVGQQAGGTHPTGIHSCVVHAFTTHINNK